MKIFKATLFCFCSLATIDLANAATINIADGSTTNVSTATTGDTINFLGNSGTLAIDGVKSLTTITATGNQKGTVSFTSPNSLTVTGNIGALSNQLQNIVFNNDGTIIAGGNIYTSSGITTTTNEQGTLTISGSAAQTISSAIGSSTLKLKAIGITQGSGAVTFSGDVYAKDFTTSSAGAQVVVAGAGALNFTNSALNQDTTINSSGNNNFGATTLANAKTLTLNENASVTSLTFGTSGNAIITSGKTLTVSGTALLAGDISGTGIIKGSANNTGDILFSGSLAQAVGTTVQLGDGTNRLNKIGISNSSTGGVTLNNDVYTTVLDFSNASGTSKAIITSGKAVNISGNITQSGVGTSVVTGAGKVTFSGSSAQAVGSTLGSATTDRLGEAAITNTAGITLNKNSYLTILRTSAATSITNNATLDVSTFNVDDNTTLNGTGTNNVGAIALASGKNLMLNNLTVSGDITGTGVIKGSTNNSGDVTFSGTSDKTVASTIALGDSSNRLNKVSVSNISTNGVVLNNDIYTGTLDFSNSSGTSKATITSGKIINVTGNVTQSGAGSSLINGAGGVTFAGTSAQTVNSALGSGTSDRLGNLTINNSAGVILKQDAFLTALTQTSGALTIASGKTVDVTNAVNLSGKTLNIGTGVTNLFGQIKSTGAITVDNTTNINFDYSNNSLSIPHDGTTQYVVAQGSSISGMVSNINVTDNSFLFNNALALNGNNIVTTVSTDTSKFNINSLGSDNYNLLNNALTYAGITSGLASVQNQNELESSLKTLKPIANGSTASSSMAINNSVSNVAISHMNEINSGITGFSAGNNNKTGESGIWGEFFGSRARQRTIKDNRGYTTNVGGMMFGSDYLLPSDNANVILGAALAYSSANIASAANSNDKNNIHSYQLIFYNSNSRTDALGFYNNNILNFSSNRYSTRRNIIVGSFNETAKADFSGYSYGARTSVGYNFKLSNSFLLAPNVGLKYFSLSQDNYEETGAGNAGLKVENEDFSSLYSEIGLDLTSKIKDGNYIYIPKFSTSWERAIGNNDQKSNITFIGGGGAMQNDSINIQPNKYNFGFGLTFDNSQGSSLQIKYNLQLSTKFASHTGSLQYRYSF